MRLWRRSHHRQQSEIELMQLAEAARANRQQENIPVVTRARSNNMRLIGAISFFFLLSCASAQQDLGPQTFLCSLVIGLRLTRLPTRFHSSTLDNKLLGCDPGLAIHPWCLKSALQRRLLVHGSATRQTRKHWQSCPLFEFRHAD